MKFFILFAALLSVTAAGILHGGYISSGLTPVNRVVHVVEPAPVISYVSPIVQRVATVPVVKVVEPSYAVRHTSYVPVTSVVHTAPVTTLVQSHPVYSGIWKKK